MSLEDEIYRRAHAYPGGIAALAPRMGLKETSLRHKVSPTYPTAHLSPRELVMLIEFCGFGPLHSICAELGHAAIPLPRGSGRVAEGIARSMREVGEALTVAAAAVEDGKVESKEIHRFRKEVIEAIGSLGEVAADMEAIHARAKIPPQRRTLKAA